jgi:Protein of unknown function (DUF2934)
MKNENRLKTLCTPEAIARFAQFIWRADGCPAGRDMDNWLEAEALLKGNAKSRFARRQKPLVVFLPD